ncbi:MAG: putative ABC transporter permease [Clostridiales bacterium]|nr:putative ABC transporter permease [Clostridiales bacterium]MDD7035562.1 putative ABC transporter permease [Bacillota bacterium]MDY2919854.1 putative ABC transporter permease [Lentihominibacter sp.]
MNFLLIFAFLFFIGSCLGWCAELLFRRFVSSNNPQRKWINPGFLVGPYLPLYGFGLWGMFVMSCFIMSFETSNIFVNIAMVFVIMAVTMTVIEYIAGLVFVKGMKVKLWDYSREKLNVKGIICPKFTVIWGALGTVYYFTVNTHVIDWVMWLSNHLAFSFFIGMFFGVFATDLGYSLNLSSKIRSFAEEKELVIRYEELKDFIRERREELEEKHRFLLAFHSETPIREHLEKFIERSVEHQKQKLEEAEENIKKRLL